MSSMRYEDFDLQARRGVTVAEIISEAAYGAITRAERFALERVVIPFARNTHKRRTLKALSALDDRSLVDIGVVRGDMDTIAERAARNKARNEVFYVKPPRG